MSIFIKRLPRHKVAQKTLLCATRIGLENEGSDISFTGCFNLCTQSLGVAESLWEVICLNYVAVKIGIITLEKTSRLLIEIIHSNQTVHIPVSQFSAMLQDEFLLVKTAIIAKAAVMRQIGGDAQIFCYISHGRRIGISARTGLNADLFTSPTGSIKNNINQTVHRVRPIIRRSWAFEGFNTRGDFGRRL